MLFDSGKIKGSVLLAGLGRSGTTWLAELINFDNRYRMLFEPFHPWKIPAAEVLLGNWYAAANRDIPKQEEHFIHEIVTGKLRHAWSDGHNRRVFANKRLIKAIRANLILPWLRTRYPELKIILLIRHPYAVAASRNNLPNGWEWRPSLEEILAQASFAEKMQPFLSQTSGVKGVFEETLLSWCISHYIPFKECKSHDILVVFYENLVLEPEKELQRIFAYLNIDWNPRCLQKHAQPSSTARGESRKLSGEERLSQWHAHITDKEKQWGQEVLSVFGLGDIYDAQGIPQLDIEYL